MSIKAWEKLGLADNGLEYSPPIKRQKDRSSLPSHQTSMLMTLKKMIILQ